MAIAPSFYLAVACNLSVSGHAYTADLLALDACRPLSAAPPSFVVPRSSPVRVVGLARALQGFPDRAFADYILSGFRVGFRVGFDYSSARLSQARRNLSSAREHAAVVDTYVALESSHHRRLCGPIRGQPSALGVHVSPFGVIPKSGPPGRWRLIVDLSSPRCQC